jgi:hypothetical protein
VKVALILYSINIPYNHFLQGYSRLTELIMIITYLSQSLITSELFILLLKYTFPYVSEFYHTFSELQLFALKSSPLDSDAMSLYVFGVRNLMHTSNPNHNSHCHAAMADSSCCIPIRHQASLGNNKYCMYSLCPLSAAAFEVCDCELMKAV